LVKWFKHDSDANRDPKLEKVLMKYGAEGYALYWMCLEAIAAPIDSHNLSFELEHDAEILAYRLRVDSNKVEEIMNYMVNLGLFEMNATTKIITCMKLAKRIENSIIKNPELKQIQSNIRDNPGNSGPDKIRLDKNRELSSKHSGDSSTEPSPRLRCPYQKIVDLYHEILPTQPEVVKLTTTRKSHIQARWREMPDMKLFGQFFEKVRDSRFLTGRVSPSDPNRKPFKADLSWLMKPENFAKVLEDKYS